MKKTHFYTYAALLGFACTTSLQAPLWAEDRRDKLLWAFLGPASTVVNKLYCNPNMMVRESMHAKVWEANQKHEGTIKNWFNEFISPSSDVTQDTYAKKVRDFFNAVNKRLEVDNDAVRRNEENGCYPSHCENIFPHYNAINLAVMKMMLEESPKFKSYGRNVCNLAERYAEKT